MVGLPSGFIKQLNTLDNDVTYQAQDLVSALFKIKKYKQEYYEQLYNDLQGGYIIKKTVQDWRNFLLGARFFGRAIGVQKKCTSDQDTTRNIAFCSLLSK